ncbi:MAG: hypothetical protein K8F91_03525 [Candidatus Obscuribacterales bacterium]|nr:hypothetical protein [Candidatus Obscuribacterales bacterium]
MTEPLESVVAERQGVRFGEFLAALEALTPEALANALFASKEIGIPLGRTLVVRGLLSSEDLGKLLELHGLYRRGLCDFHEIRDAFSISKKLNCSIIQALRNLGCSVEGPESVRLGELLLAAELIDANQLNKALSLQDLCGLPLGRVLCIHFNVAKEIVDAALEHQRNIRQTTISYMDAVDKLKLIPFTLPASALKPLIELDLRDLLVAGKVCSDGDLQPAINFAVANNLPLEQVLCSFDWIDQTLLSATLGLSMLIEHGYISAHEAVAFLLNTDSEKLKEQAPQASEAETDKLNLHKFLLACGFLAPQDIKELTRIMVTRAVEFGELIDIPIDANTPRDDLKKLILKCFDTDTWLAKVLVNMFGSDDLVITHARNLVALVSIGGASFEQALLSFHAIREDVARFNNNSGKTQS